MHFLKNRFVILLFICTISVNLFLIPTYPNRVTAPDTTPPEVTIISPQNTTYGDGENIFSVIARNTTEPVVQAWYDYTWYWDGSVYVPNEQQMTWNAAQGWWEAASVTWSDGVHKVNVFFRDHAGNVGSASQWFTVDISILYISSDFTFTHDLYTPIVVTADNLVIDGNGYTLSGDSLANGIYIDGRTNVTITNLRIGEWYNGIWVARSSNIKLLGNTVKQPYAAGIVISDSVNNTIEGNTVKNIWDIEAAILLIRSSNNRIIGNTITDNPMFGYIHLVESSHNIIEDNSLIYNDGGLILSYSSDNNSVCNNIIANNVRNGTVIYQSSNNRVFNNLITSNSHYGISIRDGSNNLIYHNDIINNMNQGTDTNPEANDWHHPVLEEGNYWSDYPGLDDGSGMGKHAIAGDGIGDTNLPWPDPNFEYDFYPFIERTRKTDVWRTMDPMSTPRAGVAAAVVNDKIYAIGGYNGTHYLATIEEYDPAFDTWQSRADMPTPRFGPAAAVVDGKIYAIGGNYLSNYLKTVEAYDPTTDTWTPRTNMSIGRSYHAVAAMNGKIYVFGGRNVQGDILAMVEEYNPVTDTWTTKTHMPIPQTGLAAVAVDGKIYAIGGYDPRVQEYNPVTNTWAIKAFMATERFHLAATAVNGKIYAIGGARGPKKFATMEEYNPTTDMFHGRAPMPTARSHLAAAEVNGKIYAIGGYGASGHLATMEEYTPPSFTPPPGAVLWTHTYHKNHADIASSVIETADGGFALAGYTDPIGNQDFWLVKTNASGGVEWNQTYGSSAPDWASTVIQTADGGYALAGTTYEQVTSDFLLVKTFENGVMEWNQTYGGLDYDSAHAMTQTADGGFALAGTTTSYGVGESDFWLVKTDSSGGVEWNQTFGGASSDQAYALIQTTDNGFALAGETMSYDVAGYRDFWLVKTNAFGQLEWNKTYNGLNLDQAWSLIQTTDGGYFLVGTSDDYSGTLDAWVVRTDANGVALWNRTYGGPGDDRAFAGIQTADGGFAIIYNKAPTPSESGVWLVKVDVNGLEQWIRSYDNPPGAQLYAHSLIQATDGGLVLGGYISYPGVPGEHDFWMLKTVPTRPLDTIPPEFLWTPGHISYDEGTTGHVLSWVVGDYHPDTYKIYTNSILVDFGTWTNGTIEWNVDGLAVGTYNISIIIEDEFGNSVMDTAWVTVYLPLYISSDFTFTEDIYRPIKVTADNIVIDGNGYALQGQGSGTGFYLNGKNNVTIRNVIITGWTDGIFLYNSANNTILDNTIINTTYTGIYLYFSANNNSLAGNTIMNTNTYGIWLRFSANNNTILDNALTNSTIGIEIGGCANNTISGNTITNNIKGISLHFSPNNTFADNTISNTTFGFIIWSSANNTLTGNVLTNSTENGIYLDGSNNNTLTGNSLTNTTNAGIRFWNSNYNILTGNTLTTCYDGISLTSSSNGNNILSNTLTYITNAAILLESAANYNSISSNNITDIYGQIPGKTHYGIYIENSSNTTISSNTITNCWTGIYFYSVSNNHIVDNTINHSTVSGIVLTVTSNNSIFNNTIQYSSPLGYFPGILLGSSNYTHISGNLIINSGHGIWLRLSSNYNNVSHNTIMHNIEYGIRVYESSISNLIYHNNFLDNGGQASDTNPAANDWYHPGMLEGNYWSDYPGVDNGNGTGKHAIVGDGIGDTNIPWPSSNYDLYPFIYESGWIDTRPPVLSSPADIEYEEGTTGHVISWTVGDLNPRNYTIYNNSVPIDTGDLTSGTIECNVDGLSVGTYNYTIAACDVYNQCARDMVWVTVVEDLTPPTVMIMSPQNITYATSTIPVYAINTTEPVNTASWRYWNGSWSANQPLTWDGVDERWEAEGLTWTDGSYQVQVFFTDRVGNVGFATQGFGVDTTPPTDGQIDGPAGWLGSNILTVSWSNFTDAGSGIAGYNVSYDANTPVYVPEPFYTHTFTNIPDGWHTWYVYAVDQVGNIGPVHDLEFGVDTTPPTGGQINGPAGWQPSNNLIVTWSGFTDTGSGIAGYNVSYDANAPVYVTGTSYTFTNIPDGWHIWHVYAIDNIGNIAHVELGFEVDTTPPTDGQIDGPAGWQSSNILTVSWSNFTDAGSGITGYNVSYDANTPVYVPEPFHNYTFTNIPDGWHTWYVYAFDPVGNIGPVHDLEFGVDTTPPTDGQIDGPAGWQPSNDLTVTWSGFTDTGSGIAGYNVSYDANAPVYVTGTSHTFYNIPDGWHTWYIYAVDNVSNMGPIRELEFGVDTTPPSGGQIDGPSDWQPSNDLTVTWSGFTDTGSGIAGYNVSYNANTPVYVTEPVQSYTFTNIPDGWHNWDVYAVDPVGNIGPVRDLEFGVDTTPPTGGQIDGPIGWQPSNDLTVTWSGFTDTGSGIAGYNVSYDANTPVYVTGTSHTFYNIPDGWHTWYVYAVDNVGYAGSVRELGFGVDTTPPVVSSPADIKYVEGTVDHNISWVVADLNPGTYTIYNNSVQVASGVWTNGSITCNVDNLSMGTYSFTIFVCDEFDKCVTDTVVVTVFWRWVAFGLDSVDINEGVLVTSGDIGANTVSKGTEVRIETHVSANTSLILGDTVLIKPSTTVLDVEYNDLKNSGTILGAEQTPATLPIELPPYPAFTTDLEDPDVLLAKNEAITLDPGAYGTLTVLENGTVIFTGGTYTFQSINAGIQTRLLFAGPSTVMVEDPLIVDEKSEIGPMDEDEVGAADIVFYVSGSDRGSTKACKIGKKSVIQANIYAPNGTLWIQDFVVATGAYIGNKVLIATNVELSLESAFTRIDKTPPELSSPEDVVYEEGTTGHILSWSVGDRHPTTFELYNNSVLVDSGSWINGTIDWNVDGLSVNDYNFTLTVQDIAGNIGTDSVWVKVVDTTPPKVTIISPQNITYQTNIIPVYATNTTEPVDTAWWRYWDGSWSINQTLTWDGTENQWEAESLTWLNGNYQVQVFFNDSAGNEAYATQWFTVYISVEYWLPWEPSIPHWGHAAGENIVVVASEASEIIYNGTTYQLVAGERLIFSWPDVGAHIELLSGYIAVHYGWGSNDYGMWDDTGLQFTLLPSTIYGVDYLVPLGGEVGVLAPHDGTTVTYFDGIATDTRVLNRGDQFVFSSADGGWVSANKPVTVVVGVCIDRNDSWAYAAFPTSYLGTEYYLHTEGPNNMPEANPLNRLHVMAPSAAAVTIGGTPYTLTAGEVVSITNPAAFMKISSNTTVVPVYISCTEYKDPWTHTIGAATGAYALQPTSCWALDFVNTGAKYVHILSQTSTDVDIDELADGTIDETYSLPSGANQLNLANGNWRRFISTQPITIVDDLRHTWSGTYIYTIGLRTVVPTDTMFIIP